jgi:hypothetical protein
VAQNASKLKVQAQGTPAMAVDILSGQIYIRGSEAFLQGVYSCVNNGTVSLAITTAHATLPRIDIVVAKVEDSQFSGAVDAWSLVVVAGTPAASPVVPTSPNNSVTLAQVLVGAGVTSIVNGNITDTRQYVAAAGGVIVCTSTTRPNATGSGANVVFPGQLIYETDTDRMWYLHSGAAFWPLTPLTAYKTTIESLTSSTTMQDDDHLQLPVDANATYKLSLQLIYDGDSTADFKFQIVGPAGVADLGSQANGSWIRTTVGDIFGTGVFGFASSSQLIGANGAGSFRNTRVDSMVFTTSGTAGIVKVQWAQGASSGTATRVGAGSSMTLERLL